MSLQDLEVLGYDPKELEKLRDEFNVSDEWIEYSAAMTYMYGTDQRPKNDGSSPRSNGKLPYVYRERTRLYGATEEMFNKLNEEMGNPKEWWYNPYKHYKLLLDIFHESMLSGYEVDVTPFIGGRQGETCYKVYTGSEFIKMNAEDYHRLWNEALNSYDEWRDNLFRARSKQGPTFKEVIENYFSRIPEILPPTTDTPKIDVYYKNEDGTKTYLGKAVIGAQGTTAMSDSGTFMEEVRNEANI